MSEPAASAARDRPPDSRPLHLVFGASGYIGSNLVPELLRGGHRVRATARNVEVLEGRGWQGAELVQADALDPSTLPAALAGADVAYYLVHSMAAGRDFGAIDRQAAEHFARAAAAAGVRRIVYLGGLIPPNPRSAHLKSRAETGDVLRAGPVPVTEVRAGMIIGPGSAAYEVIRDLVNHLPVMITPAWVRSRSTPIALPDLLAYLIEVAGRPEAAGHIYDAGGPESVTYEEIMRCYGRLAGRQPRILAVPVLTPRLSSYWLRFVTSVPTSVAQALVEGLEHDFIADDAPLRALVPRRLMGLEEAVRAAIEADRSHTVASRAGSRARSPAATSIPSTASMPSARARPRRARLIRSAVFAVVCGIGGEDGWFYADTLWWLRRAIDWLVGGPSFRRRRRHPTELRVGDVVDSWRVIALEPGRRLTLLMEMKGPGAGVLEFVVRPDADGSGSSVSATAHWHPAGVAGLLYWYALVPAHLFLFRGLTRAIQRRASARDQSGSASLREPK